MTASNAFSRTIAWSGLLTLTLVFAARGDSTQGVPTFCRADVIKAAQRHRLAPEHRYAPRGNPVDRCEGLYGEKHSKGDVTVRGLWRTCTGAYVNPNDLPDPLELGWEPASLASPIRLTVRAIEGEPYLMDTELPAERGHYEWPSRILKDLRHDRSQLSALATVESGKTEAYVPLTWKTLKNHLCQREYKLFMSGVPSARSVAVTITPVLSRPEASFLTHEGNFESGSAWIPLPYAAFQAGDGTYEIHLRFDKTPVAKIQLIHALATE